MTDAKQFYDSVMPGKFGDDYEYKRWHETRLKEVGYRQTHDAIVRHVFAGMESPGAILEIGSGPGVWTKLFLGRYPKSHVTVVDISSEMLARAKRVLPPERVEFVESDFLTYNTEKKFDLLFSSRMLEYIPDKKAFANQVVANLAEGGRGVLITKMPHYQREALLGRRIPEFHSGQVSPEELSQSLEKAGLNIGSIYPVTISVPLFHSALMNRFVGKILCRFPMNPISAFFSESYCVVFSKR